MDFGMDLIAGSYQLRLAVAIGLGILIGLEREQSVAVKEYHRFAGVRTYPLISMFGFGCAWLSDTGMLFVLPMGLAAVAALSIVAYYAKVARGGVGTTTNVATMLMYIIGAMCLLTDLWIPLATGITSTFLLSEKAEIETYVRHLEKSEFLAVVKLLIVTLIVLPVLPDKAYTSYALNPRTLWLIVILVSSIGFTGYFLSKRFGGKVGLSLSGLLGGIVSSTATSFATGRIARSDPGSGGSALRACVIASSIMYLRVLAIIWIVNRDIALYVGWRLVLLSIVGLIVALTVRTDSNRADGHDISAMQNPFELRPALTFAVLLVLLTIVTRLVKNSFGSTGVLLLSLIVGVVDVDPYVLSVVRGSVETAHVAGAAMIVAMMSNTAVKGLYFGMQARGLFRGSMVRYGIWALLHLPIVFIH